MDEFGAREQVINLRGPRCLFSPSGTQTWHIGSAAVSRPNGICLEFDNKDK